MTPRSNCILDGGKLRRAGVEVRPVLEALRHSLREWRPATAMDLSRLGCRLRTGEDLPRESKVSVRVEFRMADEPVLSVDGIGTVMWSRLEGLSYQTGIQFDGEPEGLSDLLGAAR